MSADTPRAGGCACGHVRFHAVLSGDGIHACHCETCRRLVAGPFLGLDAASLEFEDSDAPAWFASSDWASRAFCPKCGAQIAWVMKGDAHTIVSAYTLDELVEAVLDTELFIDTKPAGYAFANETKKLTGAEIAALTGGSA